MRHGMCGMVAVILLSLSPHLQVAGRILKRGIKFLNSEDKDKSNLGRLHWHSPARLESVTKPPISAHPWQRGD